MEAYQEGILRIVRVGPLGPFDNNAYIIADVEASEAVIVDMPSGSEALLPALEGLRVTAILLTHSHPDHWAGYELLKAAIGAPVLCHPAEPHLPSERIDRPLADGQEIPVGGIRLRALHTPGHTPGSTCFHTGRFLIAGDTLFPGGPGRTTSPQDLQEIIRSITQRLFTLPDETLVLPGHGEGTTIGQARREYAVFASRPHPPDLCGDVLWESA